MWVEGKKSDSIFWSFHKEGKKKKKGFLNFSYHEINRILNKIQVAGITMP